MPRSLFLAMLTLTWLSRVSPTHIASCDLMNVESGAIVCKFRITGQTCVCANRIYVQSSVYADFASRLAEKVSAFKVGDGLDEKTYF
jgi:acyl-CoA reductase-like NAD-dependent aldehyde dehydrogenase